MGFITLIQRLRASREQELLPGVGKMYTSFHARSKQPLPKMKKPFASFKGTFKQAFKGSKARSHASPLTTDDEPHEDEDQSLSNQGHPLDDVGCVKYIDTFIVTDIPQTAASSPKLSTDEGVLEDLLKTSADTTKSIKPEGTPCTLGTEASKVADDEPRSNIILENAGRGSEKLLSLYIEPLPSHKRNKSLDRSSPKTTLQRTRSQTSLARHIEPHLNEPPTVISRRSSISHHSHSDVRDRLPSVTGPVQADLENGMQKLQKRTACIELSLSQRSLDQKCFSETITSSEGSAFERADVLSIRTESSMTNTTYLSSDSSCPDDDGHPKTAELGTLGEIQGDNVADNEIKVLKAQVASLKSEKDAIQQKCDEDIAFKDEQMQNVVSMCQALSAENEELKAQAKRPATSPPVRSPVQQAPSSELVKQDSSQRYQQSK